MQFKSKSQQQKACLVTKGFGNKIGCKRWWELTNQKSLPQKVKTKKK